VKLCAWIHNCRFTLPNFTFPNFPTLPKSILYNASHEPRPYRVIISGGGTGGHIFPAVAIANELRRRQPEAEILFVGANGRS
jgi:cysteine synthase